MALLSDGQVLGGSLTCRYHAWAFDSAGKCVSIPQATSERACRDTRACLKSFPVRVRGAWESRPMASAGLRQI